MPPNKNTASAENLEDIKTSLEMLAEEVSAIPQQQRQILKIAEDVRTLQQLNNEKDKKI